MRYRSCLVLCLAVAACSGKQAGERQPYPTSGQVLVNGQPAAKAIVTLFDATEVASDKIALVVRPQGWTDEQGRFSLTTHAMNDGAPEGEYRVSVQWPAPHRGMGMGPDRLGGKYAKAEGSGLTVRIEKKTNALAPFELTVDPAQIEAAIAEGKAAPKRTREKR